MDDINTEMGQLKFSKPAIYSITLVGIIHESLKERLTGLRVSEVKENDGISTFVVDIPDQTALAGILDTIYNYHLPLLKLEYLQTENREKH